MPAWERLGRVNLLYAFPATILSTLVRPRKSLRLLRNDEGLLLVIAFFVLLVPTTWIIAALISIAAAKTGYFFQESLPNYGIWKLNLWGTDVRWKHTALNAVRIVIHCTAFPCATLALWLPALVALDLTFWRNRRPFRLLAKALFYSMVWACAVAALAATLGRAVMAQFDMEWAWDTGGRDYFSDGVLPWICWVALAVVTWQCTVLLWFVRSPRCAYRHTGVAAAKPAQVWIGITWLLAVYMLLLDRHIHLRFHLQFVNEELWRWYREFFSGL